MTTGYDTAQAEIARIRVELAEATSPELIREFEDRIEELEKVKPT